MVLVGYWPLDEGSRSTAMDYSGNGNDGDLNGSIAQGQIGILNNTSYRFDGTDGYVDTNSKIVDNILSSSRSKISISMWLKTSSSDTEELIGVSDASTPFLLVEQNNKGNAGSLDFGIRDDNSNNV